MTLFRAGLALMLASTLLWPCVQPTAAQLNQLAARAVSDELPKVPPSLVRDVEPYTNLSAYALAGWNPAKRELWTKSLASNASSVFSVPSPGGNIQRELLIPTNVYDIYFNPQGKSLVYVKDNGGNEVFQLYTLDASRLKSSLVSDGKSRNTEPVRSNP